MKILLVITRSELGGAQSVVIELANALCREHSVVLAAGEGDGKIAEMTAIYMFHYNNILFLSFSGDIIQYCSASIIQVII